MDTYSEAKTRFLNHLIGKGFEGENLFQISQAFDFAMADYSITAKSTSLVAYDESIRRDLNNFFIDKQIRGLAKSTIHNQQVFFQTFVEYVGNIPTAEVSTVMLEKFLMEKEQNGVAPNTIDEYRGFLNTFFEWTTKHQITPMNVAEDVLKRKAPKTLVPALRDDEIALVREFTADEEHRLTRTYIEFLYATGVRVNELVNLKRRDICPVKDLNIWLVHVRHGKGDRERYALLDAETRRMVDEYLTTRTDDNPYLFVSAKNAEPVTPAAIRQRFRRVAAEIFEKTGIEIEMNPHKWRHTYAANLLQNGMDITSLQQTLGHSSISTTQIYARQSLANAIKDYVKCRPNCAAPQSQLDFLKAAVGDYMNS